MADPSGDVRIEIQKDGPYTIHGGIPLARKEQVVSEYGEPLTWKTVGPLPAQGEYDLCRCGKSGDMPFCDQTHSFEGFDGTETADTGGTAERQVKFEGGTHIVVKRDYSLCQHSGFCGNATTNVKRMVPHTDDTQVRAQVMAMIERCPSGSYVFALEEGGPDIEPDLPAKIAVTTEIMSDGPVNGPLWVTGKIPVERSDGQPVETRNRVTLCCCGRSRNKPLCDGTHRAGH
jgi:CDGSH-type Zn-finger protein